MNAAFASRLVRGWVAAYTGGLPAEVGRDRSDEIESDLWSQQAHAGATGRSGTSLAVEILARLFLGIPADLAWRLDQGRLAGRGIERSTTMGTRIIALLALFGGIGMTVGAAIATASVLTKPEAAWWHVFALPIGPVLSAVGIASLVAVSVSLGALGYVLLDRFDSVTGGMALIGALSGLLSAFGAGPVVMVLPIASAFAVVELARIHAVRWPIAALHAGSAPGIVLLVAASQDRSLTRLAITLTLVWCASWVPLGAELLRGLPQRHRAVPSAAEATRG